MYINPSAIVDLRWGESFGPILARLDAMADSGQLKPNLYRAARSLLHLLAEGETPAYKDVFRRVVEDDAKLPQGPPVGYDEPNWLGWINRAATSLKTNTLRL